ncbi:MAG: alkylmercury lyase [Luteitalea sp.]|nr:alkylmercury lyase [Luteitalea sp.]
MTTANLNQFTLDELADHYAAWLKQVLPAEARRLMVPILRELATTGQPLEPQRLATLAGLSLERTLALLREAPTEWDPSGERVVGGFGLTSIPTPHRYEVRGHSLWVWCAVDALMFPVLIGAPALIQSPCVATGDPIQIDLSPTGVARVEPASAVVSFLLPATDLAGFREAACKRNNFYRSAEDAASWLAKYSQGRPLPAAEAFEVYRRAAVNVWGEELSRG